MRLLDDLLIASAQAGAKELSAKVIELRQVIDKCAYAFERGVDDGLLRGVDNPEDMSAMELMYYKRGYDHGVWLYGEHDNESQIKLAALRDEKVAVFRKLREIIDGEE